MGIVFYSLSENDTGFSSGALVCGCLVDWINRGEGAWVTFLPGKLVRGLFFESSRSMAVFGKERDV